MTTEVDIVNEALQCIGSRTTVASLSENSNEAIQANLLLHPLRDALVRMAPWNAARNYANLTLITAAPGTPENTSFPTPVMWNKGLPAPPWAYEYQYPVDCLRPIHIVSQQQTGFSGGVPITTAVTGGAASMWTGPPAKFQVGIDQFFGVTAATPAFGGNGYLVGDLITLAGTPAGAAPIGAPAVLQVTAAPVGAVTAVSVVSQLSGESPPVGGSYFKIQTNPVAQASTTGAGSGATFNLVQQSSPTDQRVILTNWESATLCYLRQIVDPNVMDELLRQAWITILGARLVFQLTGDKALANMKVQEANTYIVEARKADGNEGLTINDVTPDWVRVRGIEYPVWEVSPNNSYDYGPMFSMYG
jgi:hypothetical protein